MVVQNLINYGVATKLFLYLFRHPDNQMNYESQLKRNIDCTYSGFVLCAQKLEKLGFLEAIRKSRRKYLKLTIKAKMIAQNLNKLDKLLK